MVPSSMRSHALDEHLARARVRARGGEDHRAARVAKWRLDGIVLDPRVAILCVERGVTREPKLADEVRHNTEEARVVVEPLIDQSFEAIHPDWRPLRLQLDDHTLHVAVRERL